MEVKPDPSSPLRGTPSLKSVSADDNSRVISNEASATDGESVAVVFDFAHLSSSKTICHFSCKECLDLAKEPVINVICGHLFCWSCLCRRLTPPDPRQRGFLRGCPFCKSHLDISPTSMSTVLSVYSGPEPGVEFPRSPERESDDEMEREREEAIRKEGMVYVAPRPVWHASNHYTSKIQLVVDKLFCIRDARLAVKRSIKWMGEEAPNKYDILRERKRIDELMKKLKMGWLWLTGDEYPRQPEKINEQGLHVILDPADAQSTDISTFACRICKETAFEPVVTVCGHLFCWTCLWNKVSGLSKCPVCDENINLFASRADVNSIYCEPNDPYKEDEILKCCRKGFKQEIQAPSRPYQDMAVSFLDNMIQKVTEGGNVIMDQLCNLQSNSSLLNPEQIKKAYLEINKVWDMFYADLLIELRNGTGEEVKESQIEPTILDFISSPKVVSDDAYGIVYQNWGYFSDCIGDRMIN